MRPIALLLIAAASLLPGAQRPRYGGALRIETRASLSAIEPGELLTPHVFETLVQVDERGQVKPWLALAWTHDTARKRWVFEPRPDVVLQDGTPWNPGPLTAPDNKPIEEILRDFARPRNAIAVRRADGSLMGTGPFLVQEFLPGKRMRLIQHESHWGGRPFLDAVEFTFNRSLRDQALDLELDKADIIDAGVMDLRRILDRKGRVTLSKPVDLIALVCDGVRATPALREALALSLDRTAIHRVLLQRQGEPSGSLLPQWLSGYAFLFATTRDTGRARTLAASATLGLSYDRQDAVIAPVAERIAVNASEAGLTLKPVSPGEADIRVVRFRIATPDTRSAIAEIAAQLRAPLAPDAFETERAIIESWRVIPIVHLPLAWQLAPRVKNFNDRWNLADVWIR